MREYSAKETYSFIDPTDRSHPIAKIRSSRERREYIIFIIGIDVYRCVYGVATISRPLKITGLFRRI